MDNKKEDKSSGEMNIDGEYILEMQDLNISLSDKYIVKGINLKIKKGSIAVIMGPNGSGKSTLAQGLMGHPNYAVHGEIFLNGENITQLSPDEKSKKGLFLSFQYPAEISGVTISNFLRTALNARRDKKDSIKLLEFNKLLHEKMELLHISKNFASRYVNDGFSGGEKKKMEILQMAMLNPKIGILDETDSGLDIDALKTVCESINALKAENKDLSLLIITHYQRILNYLKPDKVYIMDDGKIIREGGHELVNEIEEKGYKTK